MNISIEPLIYLAIFIGVIFLIEGIYLMVFGKSISLNSRVNRRLDMLEKGARREEVVERLRKEQTQHSRTRNIPLYSMISNKAEKAAIAFTPEMLIAIMGGLALLTFVLLSLLTGSGLILRIVLSVVFGIGAVTIWVNKKAKERLALLEEQLPDAVELMVRSLRVGHPLTSAIGIVAKETPDPLGSEIGIIADEASFGRDISEALTALGQRTGLQDIRFLAVAVGIQQKSGGNLAEILAGLAKVIRSRFKLFRKVKTITAEARWSGIFLSSFPVLVVVLINVGKPDYFDNVADHSLFVPLAITVACFLIMNIIYMRALVNIKV